LCLIPLGLPGLWVMVGGILDGCAVGVQEYAVIVFAVLLQIAIPPPRGFVNDFAGLSDAASIQHMEAVVSEVREKTKGEIAVVTLPDIDDRAPSDVALQIGRQWGVGAKG